MKIQPKPVATITFAALGIFWVATGVLGEGSVLLIIPGIANLVCVWMIMSGWQRNYARTLMVSTAAYNSILTIYQAYASTLLIQGGLFIFGSIALGLYSLAALSSVLVLLIGYSSASGVLPAEAEPSEESKTKSDSQQQ
ncbi:MAG: hypothetical protein FJ358_02190 [Thaumarchaeota archaeon]|nr:hypothetical protein [Nitrososphaerota archaeon]